MSNFLKPQNAFREFTLDTSDPRFDYFDVRKFFKCLSQDYLTEGYNYGLRRFDFLNKSYYDRIPRMARYHLSENAFTRLRFEHYDFYEYKKDIDEITLDYCREMLSLYPTHKKTTQILKKYRKDNPELFV